MNNFWTVLFHTYLSKLTSKQFIISTIITLLIILGLTNMTKIINFFESKSDVEKIAVMDQTDVLFPELKEQVKIINPDIQLEKANSSENELKERVSNEEIKGYLVLSLNDNQLPKATYKANSLADTTIPGDLEAALQQINMMWTAKQLQLTEEALGKLNTPVAFEKEALNANAKTEEELNQARGLVYVLLFMIYFAVVMYANMIAMEVATEKSSRIMEILISSVPPVTQMFAKIFGIALLGLTQLALWLMIGYISIKQNLNEMEGGFFTFFGFENTSLSTIIYALIFFILGYLLYATMAALLGSLVSRIEDVQQMITPLMLLVVAGFMLAIFGLGNPEASYVTITSYIPLFTPMLMFLRVGMLDLPIWEPLVGIALLIATIILLAIFGARVYKGGVLMYGKANVWKNMKKALQLSNDQ
ncbi:ABC transporter permease [Bacillus alveayuensis]|uniref:ABC transporter permease n=1 Tax=Aeribacillus alveayuensis TaxID=279215 RepID=UPI0005CDC017|nr:ABC transporter permease [Bacillus alveayuensis]